MTRIDPDRSRAVPLPPPASMNGHAPHKAVPTGAMPVPSPPASVRREAAAPRTWTARGLGAAALFVVIGALILMWAVPAFSRRDTVLVITHPVPIGSVITDADLGTAKITADPALKPISAAERATVLGKVAVVGLSAGSLLTRDELGVSDGFTAGQVLVALGLKEGQFPVRGVAAGQAVLIVPTPGTGSAASGGSTGASPAAATRATVTDVGPINPSSGVTVVDVRVAAAVGVAMAQLASTGNVALILLPAGG